MIISACSIKGGVGKSTFITNLAVSLNKTNKKIIIVDTDEDNKSAINWLSRSIYKNNIEGRIITKSIKSDLKRLSNQYDYILIDVAGKDSIQLRNSFLYSDKVIFLLQPTQAAIESAHALHDLVVQAKEIKSKTQFYFLLNDCSTHYLSSSVLDAKDYLSEFKSVKMINTCIYHREAYRKAMLEGNGVIDILQSKAQQEFNELTKELKI